MDLVGGKGSFGAGRLCRPGVMPNILAHFTARDFDNLYSWL